MRVLVIGGTRFVGYQLVWRLLAAGHTVTLFNRGSIPDPFGGRVERLQGDRTTGDFEHLLDGRTFDAAVDFAVFHAADAEGVVRVLAPARLGHYVLISTGQVYLVRTGCPHPARESDYHGPLMAAPTDPGERKEWDYGMGKRGAEDVLAHAWAEQRFPSTCLRLPMVNGERDHNRRVESYLWRILDGGPILLPDGGEEPTRHVYAGDVVRAIVNLLGDAKTIGQAYNLAQEETPTLREIVRVLCDLVGASPRLTPVARERILAAGLDPVRISPFSGRWMSFLDTSRARAELGFTHEPLASYLGKVVASFFAHPPDAPPASYASRDRERDLAVRHSTR